MEAGLTIVGHFLRTDSLALVRAVTPLNPLLLPDIRTPANALLYFEPVAAAQRRSYEQIH